MNSQDGLLIQRLQVCFCFLIDPPAQWDKKPYAEWTEKDAQKVLNDSPWGKRRQSYDSPDGGYKQEFRQTRYIDSQRLLGLPEREMFLRVRLLLAKPIRQALSARSS